MSQTIITVVIICRFSDNSATNLEARVAHSEHVGHDKRIPWLLIRPRGGMHSALSWQPLILSPGHESLNTRAGWMLCSWGSAEWQCHAAAGAIRPSLSAAGVGLFRMHGRPYTHTHTHRSACVAICMHTAQSPPHTSQPRSDGQSYDFAVRARGGWGGGCCVSHLCQLWF